MCFNYKKKYNILLKKYDDLIIKYKDGLYKELDSKQTIIYSLEEKLRKINSLFLILPDKTLIRKENIIAVTQSFTEMEYYIVIDMNREGFVKSFNYGKDKKLMQKDYNSIIEQLQYKEDF